MPAVSKAQARLMGACLHGKDYTSCPKHMSREQLREFASTSRKGLPEFKRKKHGIGALKRK
jgi:hypothetical protein